VFFLVLIQLTKAIGGKGLLPPETAAWIPNLLVGTFAIILMARVRT
jgi:lipopolysaccharide export system permease protein